MTGLIKLDCLENEFTINSQIVKTQFIKTLLTVKIRYNNGEDFITIQKFGPEALIYSTNVDHYIKVINHVSADSSMPFTTLVCAILESLPDFMKVSHEIIDVVNQLCSR
jgi:predicted esterase YcpF (UPF0227 family)